MVSMEAHGYHGCLASSNKQIKFLAFVWQDSWWKLAKPQKRTIFLDKCPIDSGPAKNYIEILIPALGIKLLSTRTPSLMASCFSLWRFRRSSNGFKINSNAPWTPQSRPSPLANRFPRMDSRPCQKKKTSWATWLSTWCRIPDSKAGNPDKLDLSQKIRKLTGVITRSCFFCFKNLSRCVRI